MNVIGLLQSVASTDTNCVSSLLASEFYISSPISSDAAIAIAVCRTQRLLRIIIALRKSYLTSVRRSYAIRFYIVFHFGIVA
jgi:hypothetical protein